MKCGAQLIIPSFTKGKKQLSAQDVEISRKIASVRIHIERIIGLIKNRYAILQGTLPINVVKSVKDESRGVSVASVDKLVSVCASLVNLVQAKLPSLVVLAWVGVQSPHSLVQLL